MKLNKSYSYTNSVETQKFKLNIKVSTEFKFFYAVADIPEPILAHAGDLSPARRYFDSFYELEQSVLDMIEKYEASFVEETKEKIIAYFFESDSVTQADGGQELRIAYRVVWKFQAGNEVKYQEERRRGNDVNWTPLSDPFPREYERRDLKIQEMPWTAEREAWFDSICKRVAELSRSFRNGIGAAPTVLARKIDQNVNLLLPGKVRDGQD